MAIFNAWLHQGHHAWLRLLLVSLLVFLLHSGAVCLGVLDPKKDTERDPPVPALGILNITFKYVLEIISPVLGTQDEKNIFRKCLWKKLRTILGTKFRTILINMF